MKQTEMLYINYDGLNTSEIYGVSKDRVEQISEVMATACAEIIGSIADYIWQKGNKRGLHKGKIIKRFFKDITEYQERMVVLSFVDQLLHKLTKILDGKSI